MQLSDRQAELLPTLHAFTEGAVELRACPNKRGDGRIPSMFTRDAAEVAAFVERWDVPGYGVYFGVCTRDPASMPPGTIATTAELPALWVDIDGAKPIDTLLGVMLPPSIVVDSGGGLHGYWLLSEPEDVSEATDNDHPLVALLRRLKDVFGGDLAVCDLARIMRLPGTRNTKYGDARTVAIVHQSDVRYHLHDVEEWLSWQPQLRGEPINPFVAAAERLGVRGTLDVDRLLADMRPGNLHDTLLRVSASLTASGQDEDSIVAILMPALKLACGEEGRRKNWKREESSLRSMISGARKKFGNVVPMRKPVEQAKPKPEQKNTTAKVGAVALEAWARPIIAVDGELWTYDGGIWLPMDGAQEHRLRACIQGAAEALNIEAKTGLLNSAWRWVVERPGHIRDDVMWDRAGVVVGENGALRLADGALLPHSQEHYATRRVGCRIDPQAECPRWLEFIVGAMGEDVVGTLQEYFGACLIRGKTRNLTRGLFVHGPSHTGKTQVAEVLRALIGGNTVGLRVRAMSERFGLQALIGASGWIADDAVGQHEVMDAETYKVVVTGESVSVERKNKTSLETRFDMPVLLTMNNFPVIKDNSDAVYNRTLAIAMSNVISERDAKPVAATVVEHELAGVLNWALEGWRRLSERGWYDPPEAMKAGVRAFKDQNNPMVEFAEQMLEKRPEGMITSFDLHRAFNAWLAIEVGARQPWSMKAVTAALQQVMPKVSIDRTEARRVLVGVWFEKDILQYLNRGFGEPEVTMDQINAGLPHAIRNRHLQPLNPLF